MFNQLIFFYFSLIKELEKSSKSYVLRKRSRLSSEIQINVVFRIEKLQFVMEPTESIWTLKQKIQHSKGVSADQQNLTIEGSHQPLVNMRTLLDCGIGSGSKLLHESDVCQHSATSANRHPVPNLHDH